MSRFPKGRPSAERVVRAAILGVFGGLLVVAIPYFAASLIGTSLRGVSNLTPRYGASVLFILPFVQSAISGILAGRDEMPLQKWVIVASVILVVDYGLAFVVLREGIICLLMALPIFATVIVLGLGTGYVLCQAKRRARLHVSLIPVVMLAVSYDTLYGDPVFSNAIVDSVTIDAPPDYVWRYIVQYPENTNPPDYWLWKIGLPAPIQSTAAGASVGAARQCRFTEGIAFGEEITELVPDKLLVFKVTKQPDHPEILGHFSLDKGQLLLKANPDGTTTVVATSWYRIFVRPAWYFDWWAADITRNIHFRVLDHIKALAEADKRADVAVLE